MNVQNSSHSEEYDLCVEYVPAAHDDITYPHSLTGQLFLDPSYLHPYREYPQSTSESEGDVYSDYQASPNSSPRVGPFDSSPYESDLDVNHELGYLSLKGDAAQEYPFLCEPSPTNTDFSSNSFASGLSLDHPDHIVPSGYRSNPPSPSLHHEFLTGTSEDSLCEPNSSSWSLPVLSTSTEEISFSQFNPRSPLSPPSPGVFPAAIFPLANKLGLDETFNELITDAQPKAAAEMLEVVISDITAKSTTSADDGELKRLFSKDPKDVVSSSAGRRASEARRIKPAKFFCTVKDCEASFTRNAGLKSHIKSHLGITDLECLYCHIRTGTSLDRHMKRCKENPNRTTNASKRHPKKRTRTEDLEM